MEQHVNGNKRSSSGPSPPNLVRQVSDVGGTIHVNTLHKTGPRTPQPCTGPDSESEDENTCQFSGPFKQLWSMLSGDTEILSPTIIHNELGVRRDDLLAIFTTYQPDDFKRLPIPDTLSLKEKMLLEFTNKWKMSEGETTTIFTDYILFEYKGVVTSLNKLLTDEHLKLQMMKELENFYRLERLCKLYCCQVILFKASDETHPYNKLFYEFITADNALKTWTECLCNSLKRSLDDEERVQVLHTLTILLAYYCQFDDVLEIFTKMYIPPSTFRTSKIVLLAEAVLMYTFVQCGEDDKNHFIRAYLDKHAEDVKENKYLLGAWVCAFKDRCAEDAAIAQAIRTTPTPSKCVESMLELLIAYHKKAFKNKHGLSEILTPGISFAAETILANFNKELFGTPNDWLKLFCTLMRQPQISEAFIKFGRPAEFTNLYEEYCIRFPIDSISLLQCWEAMIYGGCSGGMTVTEIFQKRIQIGSLAEIYDDSEIAMYRSNDGQRQELSQDREVAGIKIKAGSPGMYLEGGNEEAPGLIVWSLPRPVQDGLIWNILYNLISKPLAETALKVSKDTVLQIVTIAKLIVQYSKRTISISPEMLSLAKYVTTSLRRLVHQESNVKEKCILLALYTRLIHSLSTFDPIIFLTEAPGFWPTPHESNLICHFIMTHESVSYSPLEVTRAFLKLVAHLFRKASTVDSPFDISKESMENSLRTYYMTAIYFIRENILPGYVRWKIPNERERHELLAECLAVFLNLFSVSGDRWVELKNQCCNDLIGVNSPVLQVLKTDEYVLQEGNIRPTEANGYLPNIVHLTLKLVVQLATYRKEILQTLDNTAGLAIVHKLGRMLRHRVNSAIPTLSVCLLKKFAEESNMSILCCLGADLEPFCDLILQRLEYKSEDVHLKSNILEFLTVCAQTQSGLIGHLLENGTLIRTAFDFLEEHDGKLVLSACDFIRALVKTRNSMLIKHRKNIWNGILIPLKGIDKFIARQHRQDLLKAVFQIMSLEIFANGLSDPNFALEFKEILSYEIWSPTITAALDGRDQTTYHCLLALKHFFVILLSKADFNDEPYEKSFQTSLQQVSDTFWSEKEMKESQAFLKTVLAELMLILMPWRPKNYLSSFCQLLVEHFYHDDVTVQLPLLSCVNKCISGGDGQRSSNSSKSSQVVDLLSSKTIEQIIIITSKTVYCSTNYLDKKSDVLENGLPLFCLAAKTIANVVGHVGGGFSGSDWIKVLEGNHVVQNLVYSAHLGMKNGLAPDYVLECLKTLIVLSNKPPTSTLVRTGKLPNFLWQPVLNYSLTLPEFGSPSAKWFQVYMNCFILNSCLMHSETHYYLEDALKFWSMHTVFLCQKLIDISELASLCYLQSPVPQDNAANNNTYYQMHFLLEFGVIGCYSVFCMLSYLKEWRLQNGSGLLGNLVNSMKSAVETAVSLLSQPSHLLLLINKNTSDSSCSSLASTQFRLTPELLDLQSKLWEFITIVVNVFERITVQHSDLLEFTSFIKVLASIINVSLKAGAGSSSKQSGGGVGGFGDKKLHPSLNDVSKVPRVVQKCILMLNLIIGDKLKNAPEQPESVLFIKEHAIEIMSICDSVRRTFGDSSGDDDASIISLCSSLEECFKNI